MRIVHVIPSLEGGGAERQLTYLANAQASRGHDVHVVPIRRGGPNETLLDARCTLHLLGVRRPAMPRAGARALRVLHRIAPDVVHTWLLHGNVWGGAAARILGVPWVLAERSSPRDFGPRAPVLTAIHLVCGQLADAIVANSRAGMDFWESHSRVGVRKYLIPNGLPLDAIDAVMRAPADDVPGAGARPVILWAGRMDRGKNLLFLMAALETVLRQTDACVLLCGEGVERSTAEARVASATRGRVVFSGYRPDLWALMKASSVFVSVSLFEGNPNAVQEAMACGLPLVLSDIEGHRHTVDGEAARFVRPGDVSGLATALIETVSEPDSARARARRARRIAESLSMEVVAREYDRVYADAARKKALQR